MGETAMLAALALAGVAIYYRTANNSFYNLNPMTHPAYELQKVSNKPMVQERAHEAMGPALEGHGGITLDRAYSWRVANSERNVSRPALLGLPKNRPAGVVLTDIQNRVSKSFSRVPEKTAYMYHQDHAYNQGKVRDHFPIFWSI